MYDAQLRLLANWQTGWGHMLVRYLLVSDTMESESSVSPRHGAKTLVKIFIPADTEHYVKRAIVYTIRGATFVQVSGTVVSV